MRLWFLCLGVLSLVGLTSCSRTSSEAASTPKVGLDVALHALEEDTYTNLRTGETFTEAEEIARMLEDGNTADDDFLRLVQSVGGYEEYGNLLRTLNTKEAKALHAKFGVGFSTKPPGADASKEGLSPQFIGECVKLFPPADRNKAHWMDKWKYAIFIDNAGRPNWANKEWELPTIPRDGGRDGCQTTVGKWGIRDDIGGHLVAATLNGYPRRANIVPQNRYFNNSEWRIIENTVKRCVNRSPQTSIRVVAVYTNSSTLRPTQIHMYMKTFRYAGLLAPFDNVRGGGPGTSGSTVARQFAAGFRPYCG